MPRALDLIGEIVVEVSCDAALHVTTEGGWFITVENEYEFLDADGRVLTTVAGDEPQIVELLTASVGSPLTSLSYTDDGHLQFGVASGVVRVAPWSAFESWGIVGPNQERVIATPGGALAIWS